MSARLWIVERYFRKNGAIGDFGECDGCIFRTVPPPPANVVDLFENDAKVHGDPLPTCSVVDGNADVNECPALDDEIRRENEQNAAEFESDKVLHRELDERSEGRGR